MYVCHAGVRLNLAKKTEFAIDIARGMNCLHEQRPGAGAHIATFNVMGTLLLQVPVRLWKKASLVSVVLQSSLRSANLPDHYVGL